MVPGKTRRLLSINYTLFSARVGQRCWSGTGGYSSGDCTLVTAQCWPHCYTGKWETFFQRTSHDVSKAAHGIRANLPVPRRSLHHTGDSSALNKPYRPPREVANSATSKQRSDFVSITKHARVLKTNCKSRFNPVTIESGFFRKAF